MLRKKQHWKHYINDFVGGSLNSCLKTFLTKHVKISVGIATEDKM